MAWGIYIEKAKDIAAAAGVGGAIWSVYAASGLPVPATLAQVEQKIAIVDATIQKNQAETRDTLDGIKVEQLDGRRAVIRLTRISLRNEQSNIQRVLPTVDVAAKITMQRRLGEIGDTLKELDDADSDLRQRMDKLRQ